jgi:hypothetical protein
VNPFNKTLYRVLARHAGRAISIRTSSGLSPDPEVTIGVATIKIVTEEHIQAVAFGSLDKAPQVIVRLNPIGRDVSDLVPFANFMDRTIARAMTTDSPLRVWIPHAVTLEALDVLGHRYWRNQKAPSEIVRMGEICRIVAHEASFPGQQVVADAAALLQDHVVTGLSPIEEGHLDAILAWLDPTVSDPLQEARDRIRLPASGILPNTSDHPLDDRIDRLRKEMKAASGLHRQSLESQIADILCFWVLREWRLLVEGRQAFFALGLRATGLEELVNDSTKRVRYALENGFFPDRAPHRLAIQLSQKEVGQEKAELAALEHDPVIREQARRAGGVVLGVVSNIRQPRRNFKPCDIEVDSDQGITRFRLDEKIRVVGTNVSGVVRGVSSTTTGGTRVHIEITGGVRQTGVLSVGACIELVRDAYCFVNLRALKAVKDRQPWVFYGETAPDVPAGRLIGQSALAVAAAARRP